MRDTPSAIPFLSWAGTEQKWLTERGYFKHHMFTWPFHTGGIPSRAASKPPLEYVFVYLKATFRSQSPLSSSGTKSTEFGGKDD